MAGATLQLPLLMAVALGAAPAPATAKWVRGQASLAARQARVITKFCFDFNTACQVPGDCPDPRKPGMMDFNISDGGRVYVGSSSEVSKKGEMDDSPTPELFIALLDDEYFSYPEVSQVWGEANCTDILKASKKSLPLDWSQVQTGVGQKIRVPLVEKVRPRWWYVALVSCSSHAYQLSYSMHLQNQLRGWQSEFSMDSMGVFATTLCLMLAFALLLAAQLRSLHEWCCLRGSWKPGRTARPCGAHPALLLLTYAVALSLGGAACWLVYYWQLLRSGEAPESWAVFARTGMVAARTLMQILLMLLAQGQCVCSPDIVWSEHRELVAGMVLFGALSLGLELWGDTEFWTTSTEFIYDTRPGCALVAFDVLWLWTFASRSYETFCREIRARPRRFYWRYGPFFSLWFATLPLVAALARAVASWVRFGATFAVSGLAHAAALGALVHTFRPSVAVDLYELSTHEYEAINSEELDSFLKEDKEDNDMI